VIFVLCPSVAPSGCSIAVLLIVLLLQKIKKIYIGTAIPGSIRDLVV
jgi:hypothetical protein